ncbi:maleylacetoacetate isomerase [Aromatoleum aromaticum]|uniref:Maleylpyruvate isomerase n=1 Tax=Aromatoleum aromaticum (strain DSM 19018 / LMG 30748 / EbN1) TaxID=76114 RepID=Q5P739_AROAE|nr:maleylacetoacetate isomerase [Aromatoleum aromaticum]NMG56156.1 maleylacetoacetate isomerase [Aromatoleum aromaticum]CAI06872.1 Maleylpyruvate isomerase [Aromatoleum aromaticum EbN1]
MQLYNFFRSGTSHRLRIALNLKGLDYEYVAVDLRSEEHLDAAFRAVNPQALVPALVSESTEGDLTLIQSPAIIEWLEERYPTPALLPASAEDRARVRALAAIVGCDIHPINNRRILEYLRKTLGCDEAAVLAWCGTWIKAGFDALEALLAADKSRGQFCFGNTPTIADVYLIPQVESARRFNVDLSPYPNILAVDAACGQLDAFCRAAPAMQPDAPPPTV